MGKYQCPHESERNKGTALPCLPSLAMGGIRHMQNTYKIKAKVFGNSYLVIKEWIDKATERQGLQHSSHKLLSIGVGG